MPDTISAVVLRRIREKSQLRCSHCFLFVANSQFQHRIFFEFSLFLDWEKLIRYFPAENNFLGNSVSANGWCQHGFVARFTEMSLKVQMHRMCTHFGRGFNFNCCLRKRCIRWYGTHTTLSFSSHSILISIIAPAVASRCAPLSTIFDFLASSACYSFWCKCLLTFFIIHSTFFCTSFRLMQFLKNSSPFFSSHILLLLILLLFGIISFSAFKFIFIRINCIENAMFEMSFESRLALEHALVRSNTISTQSFLLISCVVSFARSISITHWIVRSVFFSWFSRRKNSHLDDIY